MAVTTLDPKTALIVVDLQAGIVALPTVHPIDGVIARAAELAAAFRKHDLPVVLVNVAGGAPGRNEQPPRASGFPPEAMEIVAALERVPTDHLVTKRTWGAFTNTDLDAYLKSHGVTHVVVCGVATSIGVESTARFAHELGYNVTLAIDAMTDMRPEAHENSVQRIFPRLGETGAAREIVALLAQSRS